MYIERGGGQKTEEVTNITKEISLKCEEKSEKEKREVKMQK